MNLEQASPTPRTDPTLAAVSASRRMRHALARLLATTDAIWPTMLRITLGGVMLPHALQKTLGLFGGPGPSNTMHWFTAQLHMPALIAASAILRALNFTCSPWQWSSRSPSRAEAGRALTPASQQLELEPFFEL